MGLIRTWIGSASEGHSRPADDKERKLSVHGQKPTDRGALTPWRQQMEGLVRTRKETDQARATHELETAEGGTFQDKERSRPSEGHLLPGEYKDESRSGHVKNARMQQEGNNQNQPMEYRSESADSRNAESQSFSKWYFMIVSRTYPD